MVSLAQGNATPSPPTVLGGVTGVSHVVGKRAQQMQDMAMHIMGMTFPSSRLGFLTHQHGIRSEYLRVTVGGG